MFKKFYFKIRDYLWYFIGCMIYSSAVTMFVSVNEISPGGITGIATILEYIASIPAGITVFILNIPILLIGFFKFGGHFIIKTSVATVFLSVTLTISDFLLPSFTVDKILASIFGGTLMGLGISLVLRHGATTGGIDILAKIINQKFKHFTVGKIILTLDGLVIFATALVYKNIASVLYSVIAIYASSKAMDSILYGADRGKLLYIITSKPNEICREINTEMHRGVTILSGKGGFTGEERNLLLCSVRVHEVSGIYKIIDKFDNNAFTVVTDVGEVIGEGFKAFG